MESGPTVDVKRCDCNTHPPWIHVHIQNISSVGPLCTNYCVFVLCECEVLSQVHGCDWQADVYKVDPPSIRICLTVHIRDISTVDPFFMKSSMLVVCLSQGIKVKEHPDSMFCCMLVIHIFLMCGEGGRGQSHRQGPLQHATCPILYSLLILFPSPNLPGGSHFSTFFCERFVETVFYVFHKLHSLSSESSYFFGVRFVKTVCYVFHKMHSLSIESSIIFGVRFVETVCYVFHKMDSLSSETALFLVCVSQRPCAMFFIKWTHS